MPMSLVRKTVNVSIRAPRAADESSLIGLARRSRALHGHWVAAPSTVAQFAAWLRQASGRGASYRGYVVVRNADLALAGVFNLSGIVHGLFCSAYLGYYGFADSARQGYMSEGLRLVLDTAFRDIGLHRVEANVQPGNARSLEFLAKSGFTREGYSRRYLKISGRWCDHVRFAMLAEDWRQLRRR
ncbi:MAG: GNAT family protein [Casimicrobiaceae bacterium]